MTGKTVLKQISLAFLSNFSNIAPGMAIGFSAVAIPALRQLTTAQISWFASIASLATPLGCLCSGPIADRFGRRNAIRAVNVCALIGWLIIGAAFYSPAQQYGLLLAGRFVTGVAAGRTKIVQAGPVFLAFWPTGRHGGLTAAFPVNMGSGLRPQKLWPGGKTGKTRKLWEKLVFIAVSGAKGAGGGGKTRRASLDATIKGRFHREVSPLLLPVTPKPLNGCEKFLHQHKARKIPHTSCAAHIFAPPPDKGAASPQRKRPKKSNHQPSAAHNSTTKGAPSTPTTPWRSSLNSPALWLGTFLHPAITRGASAQTNPPGQTQLIQLLQRITQTSLARLSQQKLAQNAR
ncbi:hypothetical protein HUJ05_011033 [Dendroctonus ponderosae]|nr:hypothetical protein HUJ05_011033 [Dendroctonus ponderosae]